jgi:hypothetical protein
MHKGNKGTFEQEDFMYHTEVYLDQKTYFAKGHVWSKVILFQGAVCYLWYVNKVQGMNDTEVEIKMSFWMREDFASLLEKESILIQKALNRLVGGLGGGVLHLYYRGQFFSSSGDMPNGIVIWGQGKCMYMSKSLENIFTEFGIEEIEKELLLKSVEQVANEWKVRLLKLMAQDSLESGYFLVWEETLHAV